MKIFLTTLLCITYAITFSQKLPIGLIVEFKDDISTTEKTSFLKAYNAFMPISDEHHLEGFNVSLTLSANELSLEGYKKLAKEIATSEKVTFTSILYQTEKGTIGGDLPRLYIRPKFRFNESELDVLKPKHIKPHYFLKNVWVVDLSKESLEPREAQKLLLESNAFEFVTVNTLHTLEVTADDTYLPYQWSLENNATPIQFEGTAGADMEVTDAWDLTTGSDAIKIAVLDSGTDTNHVDLVDNLLPGFDATGSSSKGYPNTTYSNDGHGTCAAGIIGAVGNNTEGIAGIAYSCKIVPVRIFYYINFGGDIIPFTSAEAGTNGIIWAVNTAKADVLSNSWGVRQSEIDLLGIDTAMSNATIRESYASGRGGKGVPMLFSSGNEYDDFSIWPASVDVTISVGASSMCDELKSPTDCSPEGWWGSNYGDNLDVTAPGVKVLSTDMTGELGYNGFINDNYAMFNGTSAACPNAAGVMALILSANPELSAFDARGVLAGTAEKVGGYDYDESKDFGTWSTEMGYGRVNAYEAVYYASNFSTTISNKNNSLMIYYSKNETRLKLNGVSHTALKLVVYDMSGREVAVISPKESDISLNNYVKANGTYLIHVSNNDATVQIIKAVVTP